jgi:peptidoglycan/xylan/chitin deacetylase (PgdA/CDA1 family)
MMNDPIGQGLIVMYHYVRPDEERSPAGIRPLRVSQFEAQLDWLQQRYHIVGPTRFLDWVSGRAPDGQPPCLLTFDDGTRDHAEVVTPILVRRGLQGLFFVLTWPMELGRMPLTHAVHWLLGRSEEEIRVALDALVQDHQEAARVLEDGSEAARIYPYETPLRARIKYAANMALPAECVERAIAGAARVAGTDLRQLAREWFVSADQVVKMDQAGMTIGLHGCSHRSLQVLGGSGIRREIEHASAYLGRLLGERVTWWACPFGGSGAPTSALEAMQQAMDEVGIEAAVSTAKSRVQRDSDPRSLPRLDCIDLPPLHAE